MTLSLAIVEPQQAEQVVRLFLMNTDPTLGADQDETIRLGAVEQLYRALCVATQSLYTGANDQDQRRGFDGATTWTGFQALWKAAALLVSEGRRVVLAAKKLMTEAQDADIRNKAQSLRMRVATLITLLHKIQAQMRLHLETGQAADTFLRAMRDNTQDPRVVLTRYLRAQTQPYHQPFPG